MRFRYLILCPLVLLAVAGCDTVDPTYPPQFVEGVVLDSVYTPIWDSIIVADPDAPPIYAP